MKTMLRNKIDYSQKDVYNLLFYNTFQTTLIGSTFFEKIMFFKIQTQVEELCLPQGTPNKKNF